MVNGDTDASTHLNRKTRTHIHMGVRERLRHYYGGIVASVLRCTLVAVHERAGTPGKGTKLRRQFLCHSGRFLLRLECADDDCVEELSRYSLRGGFDDRCIHHGGREECYQETFLETGDALLLLT